MIVEMRIYHCAPTRLPALLDRFTSHTLGFFEKYGIEQIGFWTTLIGPSNHALTYMLKWTSLAEREQKWNAFQADPEWIKIRAATEAEKPIVERIENHFLAPTSFSALRQETDAMTEKKRIGFIGLGMMGAPMVQCLVTAGFDLYLDDADASRADTLAAQTHAQRLTRENAASLDALITMLPNSDIVESVLLGDGTHGWSSALAKGTVVIDMSSSEPERSRRLGAALEERGLAWLDAPVSGGVKKAKEGTLAILVGGRAQVLEQCRPMLAAMGNSILHIGGAGAGHAAKALNNYVSAAGLAATVEALLVARRFGIEPEVMTDVLNASSGRSNTSENKVKQFMLSGTFASGFALQLMTKDLKIARALAQSVGYPMTLGDTTTAIWEQAAQRSTPATDHTEMYRLLDSDAD